MAIKPAHSICKLAKKYFLAEWQMNRKKHLCQWNMACVCYYLNCLETNKKQTFMSMEYGMCVLLLKLPRNKQEANTVLNVFIERHT